MRIASIKPADIYATTAVAARADLEIVSLLDGRADVRTSATTSTSPTHAPRGAC